MSASLDLALIGNCQIGALVDARGELVWCCLPRFDGDPTFCSLLQEDPPGAGHGYCVVELLDQVDAQQSYLPNSAALSTRLTDARGGIVEITDFAPRFLGPRDARALAPADAGRAGGRSCACCCRTCAPRGWWSRTSAPRSRCTTATPPTAPGG